MGNSAPCLGVLDLTTGNQDYSQDVAAEITSSLGCCCSLAKTNLISHISLSVICLFHLVLALKTPLLSELLQQLPLFFFSPDVNLSKLTATFLKSCFIYTSNPFRIGTGKYRVYRVGQQAVPSVCMADT